MNAKQFLVQEIAMCKAQLAEMHEGIDTERRLWIEEKKVLLEKIKKLEEPAKDGAGDG